jgi:peptidoglycan/LPS O-acetylase OafA/YrhL
MRPAKESANLDFLRAYAVLSVYAGHLLQTFRIDKVIGPVGIFNLAQTGVLIFFVHTSLVLMLSMERLRLEGRRLFEVFYIRRAFRIYPLSIVVVVATVAAGVPAFPTVAYARPGWLTFASNIALTQNLTRTAPLPAVLWSLPYEVQMYIVLPIIFLFLQRYRSRWIPVCLWIVDVAAIALMLKLRVNVMVPSLLLYTPCFLGGVIGYRLWREGRMDLPFWGWPLAIASCVLLHVAGGGFWIGELVIGSAWPASLILGATVPLFRELRPGWIRSACGAIAKYSYGIYLTHTAVFWIAFVLLKGVPLWTQAALCAVLSVLLPVALYHAIERPLMNVGTRIAFKLARAPQEIGAPPVASAAGSS